MPVVHVRWSWADAPASSGALLSAPELARLEALRRPADRAGFRSAHLLARRLVAELTGTEPGDVHLEQRCPRCTGPHGPPAVASAGPRPPRISWSRAGRIVVASAVEAPVGVGIDVEAAQAIDPRLAEVALAPAERAALAGASDPAEAVLRWWVRKEAVLKAMGQGLEVAPDQLELTAPWEAPAVRRWPALPHPPAMAIADLDLPGRHVGAVAAVAEAVVVSMREDPLRAAAG